MNNQPTVATPSPRVAELEAKRQLVRTLMGGTKAMISAGKTWLPQHPGESEGNYKVRLEANVLTNFVEQAISKATNRIFAKEISLRDLPPEIEALFENIDRQGCDLNAFVMDVLRQAFEDGISYILVDKPVVAGVKTVAEEKAAGIRPYAVHIKPCCLLEALSKMIDGVQTLTRVRITECAQIPDGDWGYKEQLRVRVLLRDPDGTIRYELWEEQEVKNQSQKEWVKIEEGWTAMKQITLVPIYTNRTGFMEGEPPFRATAELNLDHWRVKSEQKNALTMNCFEMLAATGVSEEWSPEVGPAKVQRSSNENAKFYYLSPTGNGVKLAGEYLKEIEAQIDSAAASLRVERAGNVTATAAALDSEESAAGLKAVAEVCGDSIELMISFFAELMNLEATKTGDVEVNSDFGNKKGSDVGLQELGKARQSGDLSRASYFSILKWRGELPPEFDEETNTQELEEEGPALGTMTKTKDTNNVDVQA